jgi:hypothetical protein
MTSKNKCKCKSKNKSKCKSKAKCGSFDCGRYAAFAQDDNSKRGNSKNNRYAD